jgi:acetylornithine/succinyldiaminopimelate/putrescine aminotransferase
MQALSHDPILGHITTFGGHPVSCAAALATLQTLLETDLIQQVPQKEALFQSLLVHKQILEVRSAGLLMAVDLGDFDKVQKVIQYCLQAGVLVDWFLFNSDSIRLAPPLVIEEAEIRIACQILLAALDIL